jgi:23S rRNA pseudouridine1911/1915/1917 synthase
MTRQDKTVISGDHQPADDADTPERILSVTVPEKGATTGPKTRLDRFLTDTFDGMSRSRLKALIETDCVVYGGGKITDPSYRVKPGDHFTLTIPEAIAATPTPEDIALNIVYEDAHLIVIDKPAGMVVHPAPGNYSGTLVNALLGHCGDSLSGIGGVRRPGIVHRLDKNTSGLIVAAKTDAAHASLSEQFAARTIERAYLAVVWGIPRPRAGEIEGNIGRAPHNRKKMAVRSDGGKPALTRYRVIRPLGRQASLVECRLATGRTHQIRVHMAHIGHPVIGDPEYGGGISGARRSGVSAEALDYVRNLGRQALHARLLGFVHPDSAELIKFDSILPREITRLAKLLEEV